MICKYDDVRYDGMYDAMYDAMHDVLCSYKSSQEGVSGQLICTPILERLSKEGVSGQLAAPQF